MAFEIIKKKSGKPKIEAITPDDDTADHSCRTFVIHREDHTLGNCLRFVVMKDPRVELCGYSTPHPSEEKINLRIQTDGSCMAEDALRTGITNLELMTQALLTSFQKAVNIDKPDPRMSASPDSKIVGGILKKSNV